MKGQIQILGICGSLRKRSYNKAILKAAIKLAPKNAEIEIFDISKIPPFNQDFELKPPEIVKILKEKVKASDAILFSTPEYNYSVPGVLKNAIDWASRPFGNNSWEKKPVAIMSSSPGDQGGAKAQYHLRQSFVFLNMLPLNRPEVIIPHVHEKVDSTGKLTDKQTINKITDLLKALIEWTTKTKKL